MEPFLWKVQANGLYVDGRIRFVHDALITGYIHIAMRLISCTGLECVNCLQRAVSVQLVEEQCYGIERNSQSLI